MTLSTRVLTPDPVLTLADYRAGGGGTALDAARATEPETIIGEIEASGLRGRGGGGFPTGTKWRTVWENSSNVEETTVVVNAAEGEPGTFKDRAILANNPYQVVEGALIAAQVLGADRVVIGIKAIAGLALERVRAAVAEIEADGMAGAVQIDVFEGPGEYLYGEETALLEAISGRPPFPRLAPPFRRGVPDEPAGDDGDTGLSAEVEMAAPGGQSEAPPALINNVETFANIPAIVSRGAAWFRELGTEESPGTIVCTVSGATVRAGVGEVAMGTTLRAAIDEIGGGPAPKRPIKAVVSGVANALIPASALDTPLTYEAMRAAGSGLGSVGFIVVAEDQDLVAAVGGVSRFLAVESCGQCTPCKQDGLKIAELLGKVGRSEGEERDVDEIRALLDTVADGARCYLATQQQVVVASLLDRFGDEVAAHIRGTAEAREPMIVAELLDVAEGVAVVDEHHAEKQPDWTYDAEDSGQAPADRLVENREAQAEAEAVEGATR